MQSSSSHSQQTPSPLEKFFHDYVETVGGVCDEVEPQVYDVMLPSSGTVAELDAADREVLRVAFDPEAIPEHPGSQLASLGTPLLDGILGGAMRRGRCGQAYMNGLNLAPHDLPRRVRRALTVVKDLELRMQPARPLYFAQAVFWFQATFTSDQKEQAIIPVAMDLYAGREVRHLEKLLDFGRLAEVPSVPLAESRRKSIAAVYPAARQQVVRTIASLANARRRELDVRLERQVERMSGYYSDLQSELEEQIQRARRRGGDLSKFAGRREMLQREQRLRVNELRQKSSLRVGLRLVNLLIVRQPKLLIRSTAVCPRRTNEARELELVWDPLTESLEAVPCPRCGCPTFDLCLDSRSRPACAACAVEAGGRK